MINSVSARPLEKLDDVHWPLEVDEGRSALLRRLERGYYILRYHHPLQLVRRAQTIVKRRWIRWTRARGYWSNQGTAQGIPTPPAGFAQILDRKIGARRGCAESALQASQIPSGRFDFLGVARDLGTNPDWRLRTWPEAPHLWRFQLHYHDWLLDLLAVFDAQNRPLLWRYVTDWIQNNPISDPAALHDAWHPYCISRRLPNWLLVWTHCPPPRDLWPLILDSILAQTNFLSRNLEVDLGGNHLLENAKALVLVGSFLPSEVVGGFLVKGGRILRSELRNQVLPSGEHFERSPMYHKHMLDALLDIADACEHLDRELSPHCRRLAGKMASFLERILHPDGDLPLFGDTCLGEVPSPKASIDATKAPLQIMDAQTCDSITEAAAPAISECVGDYWVYRNQADFLIFDAGPVAANALPAHAHSDLLSFEGSLDGRRVFVDSGVFEYAAGRARRYCRSTAAHNVLQLNEAEQCDVWGQFRMGRRGHPQWLEMSASGQWNWAAATHDAYRLLGASHVGRLFACSHLRPWVCIDWVLGHVQPEIDSWVHLHPDVEASIIDDREVKLEVDGAAYRITFLSPGHLSLHTRPYCPRMGVAMSAPAIHFSPVSVKLPLRCGWWLRPQGFMGEIELRWTSTEIGFGWRDKLQSEVLVPMK